MSASATYEGMAKKTPKPADEEPKSLQTNLRFFDLRLLDAVDRVAEKNRRSRNFMINLLLEEALKALGEWPPKS